MHFRSVDFDLGLYVDLIQCVLGQHDYLITEHFSVYSTEIKRILKNFEELRKTLIFTIERKRQFQKKTQQQQQQAQLQQPFQLLNNRKV